MKVRREGEERREGGKNKGKTELGMEEKMEEREGEKAEGTILVASFGQ